MEAQKVDILDVEERWFEKGKVEVCLKSWSDIIGGKVWCGEKLYRYIILESEEGTLV